MNKKIIFIIGLLISIIIIVFVIVFFNNKDIQDIEKNVQKSKKSVKCIQTKTYYDSNNVEYGGSKIIQEYIFENDKFIELKINTVMGVDNDKLDLLYSKIKQQLQNSNIDYSISVNRSELYVEVDYVLNPLDDEFGAYYKKFNNFTYDNYTLDEIQSKLIDQGYICNY